MLRILSQQSHRIGFGSGGCDNQKVPLARLNLCQDLHRAYHDRSSVLLRSVSLRNLRCFAPCRPCNMFCIASDVTPFTNLLSRLCTCMNSQHLMVSPSRLPRPASPRPKAACKQAVCTLPHPGRTELYRLYDNSCWP